MRVFAVFVFLAGFAAAQTAPPPAFEVASVRINEPFLGRDNRWQGKIEVSPGNLTMRQVTWFDMLTWAYSLPMPQIAGPSWLELETYDVIAKAGRPAEKDEMRLMLQTLLAERFRLACHRETREIAGFALVEAKGGHKMKPPESEEQPSVTMPQFADMLAAELRAPISDKTALKGRYRFTFAILRPYFEDHQQRTFDPVAAFQAGLQKEMGLKLESQKALREFLVIDHVEREPIEN
jgi:uncharacterized protein (TIGR03435 family)